MSKSPEAFRTISEVSELMGTPAHVLRFWESRFNQVQPVKRADGGRRYYRPEDISLLIGIQHLLHNEKKSIRNVQDLLQEHGVAYVSQITTTPSIAAPSAEALDIIEADLQSPDEELKDQERHPEADLATGNPPNIDDQHILSKSTPNARTGQQDSDLPTKNPATDIEEKQLFTTEHRTYGIPPKQGAPEAEAALEEVINAKSKEEDESPARLEASPDHIPPMHDNEEADIALWVKPEDMLEASRGVDTKDVAYLHPGALRQHLPKDTSQPTSDAPTQSLDEETPQMGTSQDIAPHVPFLSGAGLAQRLRYYPAQTLSYGQYQAFEKQRVKALQLYDLMQNQEA